MTNLSLLDFEGYDFGDSIGKPIFSIKFLKGELNMDASTFLVPGDSHLHELREKKITHML